MIVAIAFALLSAMLFALAAIITKYALAYLDELTGAFVSVLTMALVFWCVAIWNLEWDFWYSKATLYFVIAGLFLPALGQRFQILAVEHVGPALTSAIGAFLPLFAIFPAILLLGETVTLMQFTGIILLIGGLILAATGRGISWRKRAFYLLFLPLGAAIVRAIAQPISKVGYNILAEPLFAMMVMTTVSFLVVGIMLLVKGSLKRTLSFTRGHWLFVLVGAVTGFGILAIQMSLVAGSVTLTASLASVTPVFSVLLGAYIFKNQPIFWWHWVVAVMVCFGAVFIVAGQSAL
ncbi:MAG: DMT family transporter [Amylibacter sp.]|nr:DMT family transporter [Amylibacter sp.]